MKIIYYATIHRKVLFERWYQHLFLCLLTVNERQYQHLFFDASVTESLGSVWSGQLEADGGVAGMFVATEGGLTRVYPLE